MSSGRVYESPMNSLGQGDPRCGTVGTRQGCALVPLAAAAPAGPLPARQLPAPQASG